MRHKLVAVLPQEYEKKVSCVEVGSEVAIALYHHRLWVARDKYPNHSPDFIFAQPTCSKCKLLSTYDVNASSLIVFPKAAGGKPKGVWLWDERGTVWGNEQNHMSFFPLPEMEQDNEAHYPFLGDRDLDKNANLVMSCDENVEVTLYEGRNYTGASLTLPGPKGWAGIDYSDFVGACNSAPVTLSQGVNFGQYSWSDRAASLVVR